MHFPGGIWTSNPSKRVTSDLRLRRRGHRDVPVYAYVYLIIRGLQRQSVTACPKACRFYRLFRPKDITGRKQEARINCVRQTHNNGPRSSGRVSVVKNIIWNILEHTYINVIGEHSHHLIRFVCGWQLMSTCHLTCEPVIKVFIQLCDAARWCRGGTLDLYSAGAQAAPPKLKHRPTQRRREEWIPRPAERRYTQRRVGYRVIVSGSTKPPAHPENGDGVSTGNVENIHILTRLSARENLIAEWIPVKKEFAKTWPWPTFMS